MLKIKFSIIMNSKCTGKTEIMLSRGYFLSIMICSIFSSSMSCHSLAMLSVIRTAIKLSFHGMLIGKIIDSNPRQMCIILITFSAPAELQIMQDLWSSRKFKNIRNGGLPISSVDANAIYEECSLKL